MTRKIMQKITDSQKEELLFGNCEANELYMHRIESKELKRPIIELERLPRRRAKAAHLDVANLSETF